MDEVLDADDVELAQLLLHEVVGGDGGAAAVDLGEAALVDQLADALQVWGTPSNVGLANTEHVDGGLVQLDEDSVVDLTKPEELEDLPDLGRDLVDTADTDDEGQLRVAGDVVAALLLGLAGEPDLIALLLPVLLDVLLGALEDVDALLVAGDLRGRGSLGSDGLVLG